MKKLIVIILAVMTLTGCVGFNEHPQSDAYQELSIELGRVVYLEPVLIQTQFNLTGALIGAAVGVGVGCLVGNGVGTKVAMGVGAVAGSVVGSSISNKPISGIELTICKDDNKLVVIDEEGHRNDYHVGERVKMCYFNYGVLVSAI